MDQLDQSAVSVLRSINRSDKPSVETISPQEARDDYLASYEDTQNPLEAVQRFEERYVGRIRCKIWYGEGVDNKNAPALLYLHGGGWVVGSPETHEDICRMLANRMNAVVISPDYRLAPDFPFPCAIEDCCETLEFLVREAESLGIDPTKITVAGDSAGGNLAAVLAIMSRDKLLPNIFAQILIYPVTDSRQLSESYKVFSEGYGLTAASMKWLRDHYLNGSGNIEDWRVSPLLIKTLEGVAPAIVALAGHDVLYEEGKSYAARLETEASAVTRVWPGQIHGFMSMGGCIPEAGEAVEFIVEEWKRLNQHGMKSNI